MKHWARVALDRMLEVRADADKHFSLDEAQTLVPVLESLLKRAIEAKSGAEEIEEKLQALIQKIFLSGGMFLDVVGCGSSARRMTRTCSGRRIRLPRSTRSVYR